MTKESEREKELAALQDKLAAFDLKLRRKEAELETYGGFLDVHKAHWKRIHEKQDELREELEEAERDNGFWGKVSGGLTRDFEALADDFDNFVERLDADVIRGKR